MVQHNQVASDLYGLHKKVAHVSAVEPWRLRGRMETKSVSLSFYLHKTKQLPSVSKSICYNLYEDKQPTVVPGHLYLFIS